jgi:hypothetical protein
LATAAGRLDAAPVTIMQLERILSIRETCRCQNRPMHPYLVDIHNARLTGAPIPTPLTA